MTQENATAGKAVAGVGLSTNGTGAHANYTTNLATGIEGDLADLLGVINALVPESKVPAPEIRPAEPMTDETKAFLLASGMSDEANAQAVARLYPGRFLHSEALGWLTYTGRQWATEGAEAVLDRALVATLIERIKVASQPEHFETQEKLRKFCLPNKSRIEGAKHLLTSLVHTEPAAFDAEPDLLNCKNGVLDLRTGSLVAHDPSQRFMHCTSVDYRPGADQSAWCTWLGETVGDEQAAWLQLAVGYSLTGHTREEVMIYMFGPPRSGKGVFTETLLDLLGSPLAKTINFGTFTAQRTGDTQNFDLAPLKPCRLVAASESNAYERLNEAKVKAITGGNEIYCAHKHRAHFNYRPQFKVWLSSNQPVNADPDDEAVWGRLRLIEFPHSHLGAEDKLLKQRMRSKSVLEGVLAWAVQGAMRWYALGGAGLSEPATSVAIKTEQREQLDAAGMWIEEVCDLGAHYFTATSALYQSYEAWCKSNGVEAKRHKGFSLALQRKGYRADRQRVDSKLMRGFFGLKV